MGDQIMGRDEEGQWVKVQTFLPPDSVNIIQSTYVGVNNKLHAANTFIYGFQ